MFPLEFIDWLNIVPLLTSTVFVIKTYECCSNISIRYVLNNVSYLDPEDEWGKGKFEKFGSKSGGKMRAR